MVITTKEILRNCVVCFIAMLITGYTIFSKLNAIGIGFTDVSAYFATSDGTINLICVIGAFLLIGFIESGWLLRNKLSRKDAVRFGTAIMLMALCASFYDLIHIAPEIIIYLIGMVFVTSMLITSIFLQFRK